MSKFVMTMRNESGDRGKRTREAVYQAVMVELSLHGYLGITVAGIVRRAGISRGRFYHHFRSAHDALRRAYRAHTDATVQHIAKGSAAQEEAIEAVIRGDLERLATKVATDGLLRAAVELHLAASRDAAIRAVMTSDYERKIDVAASALREGIRRGEFRKNCNPREVAARIYRACFGLYLVRLSLGLTDSLSVALQRELDPIFASIRCSQA